MAINRDVYLRLLTAVAAAQAAVSVDIAATAAGRLQSQLVEMEDSLGEITASARAALNLDEKADLQAQIVVLQNRIAAIGP